MCDPHAKFLFVIEASKISNQAVGVGYLVLVFLSAQKPRHVSRMCCWD